jgi:hypothetical protein
MCGGVVMTFWEFVLAIVQSNPGLVAIVCILAVVAFGIACATVSDFVRYHKW